MAKVTYLQAGVTLGVIEEDAFSLSNSTKRALTFTSTDGDLDYVIHATGQFSFSFNGDLKGGRISGLSFAGQEGDPPMFVISDIDLSAVKMLKFLTVGKYPEYFSNAFENHDKIVGTAGNDSHLEGFGGNDRIIGKGGFDQIEGGEGDDRMTGGTGHDVFMFAAHSGTDVITDFIADNDNPDRDYFGGDPDDVKSAFQHGADTVIKFSGGDKVILLGVDRHDFSSDDFWTDEW